MYESFLNLRYVSRNSLSEFYMFVFLMLICCVKFFVLYVCVFRIVCVFGLCGCMCDMKLSFICSASASTVIAVYLVSLFVLFLSLLVIIVLCCVLILSF